MKFMKPVTPIWPASLYQEYYATCWSTSPIDDSNLMFEALHSGHQTWLGFFQSSSKFDDFPAPGIWTNPVISRWDRWFGTWFLWLSIYWEYHHPNWLNHIFQRGRYTTNQYMSIRILIPCTMHHAPWISMNQHESRVWKSPGHLPFPASRQSWGFRKFRRISHACDIHIPIMVLLFPNADHWHI